MKESYYVCFRHFFVGFRHGYTNTEQSEESTHTISQARQVEQCEREPKQSVSKRNVKGGLLGELPRKLRWLRKYTNNIWLFPSRKKA